MDYQALSHNSLQSKLALGTAQFGLDYGITNSNGIVVKNEVHNILSLAKNYGIVTLDTAPDYGKSEKVLGEIGVNDFQVITKTVSLEKGVNSVIKSFKKSLDYLEVERLYGLLIRAKDIQEKKIDYLYNQLTNLKQDKLIEKIGFSAYSPEQVDLLLAHFDFDLIQIPCNIFDERLTQSGKLGALKNKNIEVHARSIFLQGILLDFENLPKYFETWEKQFSEYQKMVKASGNSLLQYSIKYILNIPEIDKVIVGVNNAKQLKDIVQVAKSQNGVKPYPIDDINLLNPSLWEE